MSDPLTPEALDTIEAERIAQAIERMAVVIPVSLVRRDPSVIGPSDAHYATRDWMRNIAQEIRETGKTRNSVTGQAVIQTSLVEEIRSGDFEDRSWMIDALERAAEVLQTQEVELRRLRTENEEQGHKIDAALNYCRYTENARWGLNAVRAALTGEATP
jgi:hypothetical protein